MSSLGELALEWWGPGTIPPPASIVWCNFPQDDALGTPGPKARPALVLRARYAADPPDDRFLVQVAYGTSKLKLETRPDDFVIANHILLDLLRLPQATRFDLDFILWLPWAKPFFCPRREDDQFASPVISTLAADTRRLLGWTMATRERKGLLQAYNRPAPPPAPPST